MSEKQRKWQRWLSDKAELERDFRRYVQQEIIRKIEPSQRLSDFHKAKAFHNLDFANFTVKNQENINKRLENETYHDWAIIISYYAMYHAALALLYKIGCKTSTHLATICALCKNFLEKPLDKKDIESMSLILELNEEEINEIGKAKERRERASYSGSVSFERHLAEITLSDARRFINKAVDMLENQV